MLKKILAAAVAATLALSGCTSQAEDHSGHIEVTNAYARATDAMSEMPSGKFMTGVFFEIKNNHDDQLVLVGGSASIAENVEVHEVVDGEMRPKQGGLVIGAGSTEILKPGGNHVMLIGLSEALLPGDEVTVTLTFDNGESLDVTAPVKVVNLDQEHYDDSSPSPMAS